MSRRLMNDFLRLEETKSAGSQPKAALSTIQRNNPSINMLLTPNDFGDLTPFGINKVLNKEVPAVLQVIDVLDELFTAKEKLTLLSPDGTTTLFFADTPNAAVSNATRTKIILPDGKVYVEEEEHMSTRPVFPLLHISDGVHFVQAIIRKQPLAKKVFTAGLKCGSIITITNALTSFFQGYIGLLEIYDFSVLHLNHQVLGNPVPFPDTTIDFLRTAAQSWVTWRSYSLWQMDFGRR